MGSLVSAVACVHVGPPPFLVLTTNGISSRTLPQVYHGKDNGITCPHVYLATFSRIQRGFDIHHHLQPHVKCKNVVNQGLLRRSLKKLRVGRRSEGLRKQWRLNVIRSQGPNEEGELQSASKTEIQNANSGSPPAEATTVPLYGLPVAAPQSISGNGGRQPANEAATNGSLGGGEDCIADNIPMAGKNREGSSIGTLWRRFLQVAAPYWSSEDKVQARLRLAAVFALTLATTGISVAFNFLGRDFYNALASKDEEAFTRQLLYYLGAFVGGIPVFVLRDYNRNLLALRWRAWMTSYYMDRYFKYRTFYNIQSQSLIDNPDQRIVDDLNLFTGTALGFSLALFNAAIDLISFSGILYGIYPPLFAVLIVYSIGGTAISVALGKDLVNLNFMQEKREADFRYGLVRVRENAESIAFYGGEASEIQLLLQRYKESFQNYTQVLLSTRNLEFFTSGYRYLIQLLPAAVVAPLYFAGKIEFGVINQSFSAFNHVLSDFSIIVYQFQALSSFSAIVDRLGEFNDVLDTLTDPKASSASSDPTKGQTAPPASPSSSDPPPPSKSPPTDDLSETLRPTIALLDIQIVQSQLSVSRNGSVGTETAHSSSTGSGSGGGEDSLSRHARRPLLEIEELTLYTPQYTTALVGNLSIKVYEGDHLLVMGASGSGKTSLLRAIAGLWRAGTGTIKRYVELPEPSESSAHSPSEASSTAPSWAPQTTETLITGGMAEGRTASAPSAASNGVAAAGEAENGSSTAQGLPGTAEEGDRASAANAGQGVPGEVVPGAGRRSLAEGGSVFFVPQRPYMVLGTLRQQLLYPTWSEEIGTSGTMEEVQGFPNVGQMDASSLLANSAPASPVPHNATNRPPPSDAELEEVLHRVRLGHLLQRCEGLEATVDWASVLSLGEQQRLAFARLLLSRPQLALMDESTSALDEQNEAHLYREVEAAGVTFVSIGHRSSLRQFHTHLLNLEASQGGGGQGRSWTFALLSES